MRLMRVDTTEASEFDQRQKLRWPWLIYDEQTFDCKLAERLLLPCLLCLFCLFLLYLSFSLSPSLCSSSTMGTCTSTARHQQRQLRQQQQQQHSRGATKNSFVLDTPSPPPLPPIPLNVFPRHPHPSSFLTNLDLLIPSLSKSILHSADTNSLIQLYSSNTNNNNNSNNHHSSNSHINWMSSSTSIPASIPPRIPVPKVRVPLGHPPQAPSLLSSVASKPTNVTSTVISNHQTGRERRSSLLH